MKNRSNILSNIFLVFICSSVFIIIACPDPPPPDSDNDGVFDSNDNCIHVSNPNQTDTDEDGKGDKCDNCPEVPNYLQEDADNDFIGDICDNCPEVKNTYQEDSDADGIGDACEYPEITESCTGVKHSVGSSVVEVCIKYTNIQDGDGSTITIVFNGEVVTVNALPNETCIVFGITEYGTYEWSATVYGSVGSDIAIGSITVDANEQSCEY